MLGAVFGALCHQRVIRPRHASAIDVAGCVAFVGVSGASKSTLVATLALRGHEIISDDVCLLQPGTDGALQAWPGISRVTLWEDATAELCPVTVALALSQDGPYSGYVNAVLGSRGGVVSRWTPTTTTSATANA